MGSSDRAGASAPELLTYARAADAAAPLALAPDRAVARLTLDGDERAAVLALSSALPEDADADADPERFLARARELSHRLPGRVLRALARFARFGEADGALVIDPCLEAPAELPEPLAAGVLALLGEALGEIVAFDTIAGGRLFHRLPQADCHGGAPLLETVRGTATLRPDVVAYACVGAAPPSTLHALSARRLSQALDAGELATLRTPWWPGGIDVTRRQGTRYVRGGLEPYVALGGAEADPTIHLDPARLGKRLERALGLAPRLARVIAQQRVEHALAPGQVALLDNRRAIGACLTTVAEGEPAPVVRSFVTFDLLASSHARPGDGRVVAAVAERAAYASS